MLIGINGGYFPAICRVCLLVKFKNWWIIADSVQKLSYVECFEAILILISTGEVLWLNSETITFGYFLIDCICEQVAKYYKKLHDHLAGQTANTDQVNQHTNQQQRHHHRRTNNANSAAPQQTLSATLGMLTID